MSDSNNKVIRVGEDECFCLIETPDFYMFGDLTDITPEPVRTPGGNILLTVFPEVADELFSAIEDYGLADMCPESLLPWHYTHIDHFSKMEHKEIEKILDESFLSKHDWTFDYNTEEWVKYFGKSPERIEQIRQWLTECTPMQMTAACCVGNALHSLNIAYVLAKIMEANHGDDAIATEFSNVGALIIKQRPTCPTSLVSGTFKNFLLYYGAHLQESETISVEKE